MHCIGVILIKKSEIRNHKIDSILNNSNVLNIPYCELPQDIIAFPTLDKQDVVKHFGDNIVFAKVETDYFGGSGDQAASLNKTLKGMYKSILETNSINDVLNKYGVKRINGNDEFDSIDLGKYRSNRDFIDPILHPQVFSSLLH